MPVVIGAEYREDDYRSLDPMRRGFNPYQNAHVYRDWVIQALNNDLPYDQFVIRQLAGDQLENPTQDELVATGFLRNSMLNEEGGIDPEQFRMEAMYDRMGFVRRS